MTKTSNSQNLAAAILPVLPFLRRYGRALTGSQRAGDDLCAATLEAVIANPKMVDTDPMRLRVSVFQAFHHLHRTGTPHRIAPENGLLGKAQHHLSALQQDAKEALLLRTIEEFSPTDVATIMGAEVDQVRQWINTAREVVRKSATGNVLIIEDEAMIAVDLQSIITDLGHGITGVTSTRDAAIASAKSSRPDLILADIKLADNSSGIDAVQDILADSGDIPVIFVTAFPERLLTGTRPEPTFLITKPYTEDQVSAAVAQAMFFASVEPLLD